jgi:hypothetical protein
MYNSDRELVEALQATPEALAGLLHNVTQTQAQQARGGNEGWSVVEVVCHLRDAEEFNLKRMQAMRNETNPPIAGWDQEALAREHNYAGDDLRRAFAAFQRLRTQNLAELAALTPEQWERIGIHAKHGETTIFNHTLHVAWHDAVHLAQIARQLYQQD